MIPFSGFMQAVTGAAPAFGSKTIGNGNSMHGLPDTGDAISLSDGTAGSFLEWVQKLMDSSATAETDGKSVFGLQNTGHESDMPAFEQLQAMIAEAMDQAPVVQNVSKTLNAESLDNGQNPVSPGIALPVLQEMTAPKENSSSVEQAIPSANGQPLQTNVSGIHPQTGQGDENPSKENPLNLDINENTQKRTIEPAPTHQHPIAGQTKVPESIATALVDKNKASSGDPTANFQGKEKQIQTRRIELADVNENDLQKGQTSDSAKSTVPEPTKSHLSSQDTAKAMAAGLSTKTASSGDDTANFQGKDKHSQTQRIKLADVNENDLQKGQTSDSAKSTVPELNKTLPSFQDTAKAVALDPSTKPADKQTAGQAAASTRTEESVAKTFQTTVMDQIVDKAAIRSIHGRTEIRIRLKPEFLGNVQMNIATDKEQLMVRIVTDQPVVKDIIETHLHHLKAELQNQGLTIDKFEVMVNPDADQQHSREPFAQMFKNNSFQNGRRQPHEQNPETLNRDGGNESNDDQPKRDGVNYFA
ncbi:MAG: flagellar hook-length control protein FliK [Desulfosarcina sp.]|nr:flagellar hook-length control protein FliK [Desulfosarcina sp.]MBC2742087.1 flagellar hook-length control protein FliK [Desulfosarcina sp.]MBC2765000.1 flagellar hook-length control protein FliK [Desulfosarcina sp.]